MKNIFFTASLTLICIMAIAQQQVVSSGTIKRIENFPSKYITARTIDIWLPDGYSSNKKYAVLYMHDGQMLFDSTHSWTHQEWGVDETMSRLMGQKQIRDCIVVGIWNVGAERHSDYFPQKPFEYLSKYQQDSLYKANNSNGHSLFSGSVHSDNYLKFIVTELKPFIDSNFSVYTDQPNTFIAGSSMGGLISMYTICEYPEVFGGAACLSTHWTGVFTTVNNPIPDAFLSYLSSHLPSPQNHKLYFDHGTETLDSMYAPYQGRADAIITKGGYTSKNFMTKVFEGDDHTERSWAKRFEIPMLFLLKGN